MSHAKSLRVVGQCLEYAHIAIFELEKYGPQYMLWSDTVNEAGETALRSLLNDRLEFSNETRHLSPKRVFVFSPADISRLDAQAQRQRKNRSPKPCRPTKSFPMVYEYWAITWTESRQTLFVSNGLAGL